MSLTMYDLGVDGADEVMPQGYACLYLDDETLKAMGIEDLDKFKAGEEVAVMGVARINEKAERAYGDGEPRMCLELRFTDLGISDESDEVVEERKEAKTVGGRLYGED